MKKLFVHFLSFLMIASLFNSTQSKAGIVTTGISLGIGGLGIASAVNLDSGPRKTVLLTFGTLTVAGATTGIILSFIGNKTGRTALLILDENNNLLEEYPELDEAEISYIDHVLNSDLNSEEKLNKIHLILE